MKLLTYARLFLGNLSSQFTNKDDSKPLDQLLEETKNYYDPVLPRKAGPDSILDSVEIRGSELVLTSRLSRVAKHELDIEKFQTFLKDNLTSEARRVRRLYRLLQKGATIIYTYKDKDDVHITDIGITFHDVG